EALVSQHTIPQNSAFQTDDLDAYDLDCDDLSSAKAVLMANLSSCDPEVLSKEPYSESYPNNIINQDVQEMQYSEQTHVDDFEDNEIHSEQAFWLKHSSLSETLVTSHTPVRIEAPSELPKCSVDKNVFEIQIKQLRIDNDQLLNQIMSQEIVHIVVNSLDICDVKKSRVNDCKKCLELETELFKKKDFIEKEVYDKFVKSYPNLKKHCISLELETQLNQEIFQRENSGENLNAPTFNQLFEINKLKAQSQEKDTVIRKLKERIKSLSGKDNVENVKKDIDEIETINIKLEHRKNVVNTAVSKPNATVAPGIFKLDIEAFSPRIKNNRDAYEELLVYVSQTCPSSPIPSGKVVAVTPINKEKRVRFTEHVTSSNNIPKQTDSLKTKDSNKPLLTSTGVKPSTCASGSKPSGNTKNNRITQPPRSNQKNKVEDHPRKVKSSLNKKISNALVKHSVRNAKFESMCAICNKCLFDANHDMCLIDFVNVRSKSKSKRNKKKKAWKPTGKVFTDVRYKWKPTGRFFTIVGNSCPLTRIIPKKIVHLKESTSKSVETPKPEIKVYSRRPKQLKSVGSSKRAKIVESKSNNNSESTHFWGSNATDVPSSSSLINDRSSRSSSGVYYVEGLRHNLFSIGQFCNADLKVAFRKNTCFIRNLEGLDLLSGTRDINLYIISLDDMLKTSLIRIYQKLQRLRVGYGTIIYRISTLYEAQDAIIKCIKNIQVRLNATVSNVRTDNGTEFVNQTVRDFYENVGILNQTSVARTTQQNGIVERQNQTLMEAARTMLIFSKAPLFLWAEAINTTCYT
ncbi:retrovirus-related pol polyprotein from transposon TNT 1-94, partial [Tanacetum coccineum]